jgi:predicted dehydrogenase
MDESFFRFAIVGSGNISRTYVSAIGRLEDVQVGAIVSRSGLRPENLQDESVPVVPALADLPADVDAVILTTPNGLHHQGAIEAARLGKHVLTEKVLDVTLEHMDAMTAACAGAGVKLAVTYQRRMSPDNKVVKRLLEDHVLGRVFAADLAVKFWRGQDYYDSAPYRGTPDIDGGGPFIQQAAHNLDIYCWFFGMPDQVLSMTHTFCHDISVEDHGAAVLRHADGMIGTLIASTACKPGFPPRLEIHAEKGSLVMENDSITGWHVDGMEDPSEAGDFKVHSGAASAAVADTAGHEAIIRDFVQAVRGDRDPAVPPASARLATELVLRIYQGGP